MSSVGFDFTGSSESSVVDVDATLEASATYAVIDGSFGLSIELVDLVAFGDDATALRGVGAEYSLTGEILPGLTATLNVTTDRPIVVGDHTTVSGNPGAKPTR